MINKLFLPFLLIVILSLFAAWLVAGVTSQDKSPGVYPDRIVFGSVLPLQGEFAAPGLRMENGLRQAFDGVTVQGRRIELLIRNDYYDAKRSAQETQALINEGIFAMIGNVGERNAEVSLPLLEKAGVPSIAFFDGSDVSFQPRPLHFQFHPSYRAEVKAMLQAMFAQGLKPEQVCAYVQQDVSGLSVLRGIRATLEEVGSDRSLLASWDRVLQQAESNNTNWNNQGPIGSYDLATPLQVAEGFRSLTQWEKQGNACVVVMLYGFELNLGNFVRYSLSEGRPWAFVTFSFLGGKRLNRQLKGYGVSPPPVIYMTQAVPLLESNLPVVEELRQRDIPEMTNISLEGFIVGKMIIAALEETPQLTREAFVETLRNMRRNLGGVIVDAPANKGEFALSQVYLTRLLADDSWRFITSEDWQDLKIRLSQSPLPSKR
jgi:ABC-type branched-subunit amino acid transport system substrate-binding protein